MLPEDPGDDLVSVFTNIWSRGVTGEATIWGSEQCADVVRVTLTWTGSRFYTAAKRRSKPKPQTGPVVKGLRHRGCVFHADLIWAESSVRREHWAFVSCPQVISAPADGMAASTAHLCGIFILVTQALRPAPWPLTPPSSRAQPESQRRHEAWAAAPYLLAILFLYLYLKLSRENLSQRALPVTPVNIICVHFTHK